MPHSILFVSYRHLTHGSAHNTAHMYSASFAQIHGLEPNTVIAFGQEPGTIVVVGSDGSFLTTNFSAGGECEKLQSARFLRYPTSA